MDGTEILGIIMNRRTGFTVGQVVLVCNIFVFGAAGFVFQDWHPALMSLITYIVVIKIMDSVIVGLDETKSVLIISSKSKAIADAIIYELGWALLLCMEEEVFLAMSGKSYMLLRSACNLPN